MANVVPLAVESLTLDQYVDTSPKPAPACLLGTYMSCLYRQTPNHDHSKVF